MLTLRSPNAKNLHRNSPAWVRVKKERGQKNGAEQTFALKCIYTAAAAAAAARKALTPRNAKSGVCRPFLFSGPCRPPASFQPRSRSLVPSDDIPYTPPLLPVNPPRRGSGGGSLLASISPGCRTRGLFTIVWFGWVLGSLSPFSLFCEWVVVGYVVFGYLVFFSYFEFLGILSACLVGFFWKRIEYVCICTAELNDSIFFSKLNEFLYALRKRSFWLSLV